MISFNYETDFELPNEAALERWISRVIASEQKSEGELAFVFCDDAYLVELNQNYLQHDTLTDIISFDYSLGNELSGDVFISVERVRENAEIFSQSFEDEMIRVIIHGILHYCGYKDKSDDDERVMRAKENEKIAMFHVEQ